MQSEPTAVSQHSPSFDFSPAQPSPTQHGNDAANGPAFGPLHGEATGDTKAVLGQSIPAPTRPSVNDATQPPPSSPVSRVVQHGNAGKADRRGADLGPRVISSAPRSDLTFDSLPNGEFELIAQISPN